ncbi:hypothetical protein F4561_005450 [Lipingzhangella halophila]|uniref:DUF4282 domain-containing protein n=1 Tax=Lipingzhangella halophila TaxID=1783352 RepID=A0A7W7RMB7_9ACTN|nr:DUF4282 domain-containing protein [Lipingzhangella halophila]MBB4934630.1 hypothetical protein [Lipingzhangella halophila]
MSEPPPDEPADASGPDGEDDETPWSLRGPVPGEPADEADRLDTVRDYTAALLDRSFIRFVTPQLVSWVYGFGLILAGLAALAMLAGSIVLLAQGGALGFFGILALIATPFAAAVLVLLLRAVTELLFVAFWIVDDLHAIRRRRA